MTKDTLGFSASDREPGSLSPVPPQRKHKGIRIEKSCVSAASCRSGLGVQVASGSGGSVDNDVFYDADDSDVGGSGGQAAETSASSSDDSLSDEIVLVCGHPADADVADIAADDIVLLRGHPVGNGAKRVSADTVVVDERPTTRGLTFDEISAQTVEMRQLSSTNTGSARGRSHSNSSAGSFRSTSNGVHSFGQRPPRLLDCLKDILKRYPEGGQILKELIQNAEDAERER
ncbi:PREDICTED: uncharacterized protein LOC106811921 [Priapulus caudatus]|uniref:Uncharacterized protein LOC106811921 n=1 Tax=Priapulus caudatus TaxID=37621 RepID=A0ABM1EG26_PRICU|nr:PREDICTED: uncharacterized protein LOC106811921 [Priapulus caudatus]